MNKALRRGNALWLIITIICLLCAGGLLYLMLQERSKRVETEQILLETNKAKRAAEVKLDQAELEKDTLKEKAKLLAEQVEQEKKNYQAVLAEVTERDEKIVELENSLANEKKQRTSLANDLAQIKESHDSLEEELKEAKLTIEELNTQIEQFGTKAGVELKKIVVTHKEKLSGKVLVVNREFHFVVIDLGRDNRVGVGDEFIVYLDSRQVGRVQVEKVYDTMSTATILSGSQEELIAEDSIVKSF